MYVGLPCFMQCLDLRLAVLRTLLSKASVEAEVQLLWQTGARRARVRCSIAKGSQEKARHTRLSTSAVG
jgi:hypothetical protein